MAPKKTAPKGQQQQKAPKPMSAPKRVYLIAYNALNALLWSVVLGRTVSTIYARGLDAGPAAVYPAVGEWTKWTQTLAALEIVHSLLGESTLPTPLPSHTSYRTTVRCTDEV